jgi:hypothetical protein
LINYFFYDSIFNLSFLIFRMTLKLLILIFLLINSNESKPLNRETLPSNKIIEKRDDNDIEYYNDYYYDDDTDDDYQLKNKKESKSQCKCMNGGFCALDDDFCVCSSSFTGRYCEIDMRRDIYNELGCGELLNGQTEYKKCAKCKCSNQILTCEAYWTPVCDFKLTFDQTSSKLKINQNFFTQTKRIIDIFDFKGEDLALLIQLKIAIENYSYQAYVNDYKKRLNYNIFINDIDNQRTMIDWKLKNRKDILIAKNGEWSPNDLIVVEQKNKILGLHFPKLVTKAHNSSSSNFNESSKLYFILIILTLTVFNF